LAELIALFSSLSDLPVAQHIAVTGSIDQLGNIQAVGGLHEKIEGYHMICKARGFTGDQGVVLPAANWMDLTLTEEVAQSIKEGHFHLWAASHVKDVVPLMLGYPLGALSTKPKKTDPISVLGKVHNKLNDYLKLMKHE
jgi:Lon-like ATP-dependent protease